VFSNYGPVSVYVCPLCFPADAFNRAGSRVRAWMSLTTRGDHRHRVEIADGEAVVLAFLLHHHAEAFAD
jgi:hypothetical protein